MNKHIGIIDADLLGHGTRHPNLACLKLSGYHKAQGDQVDLIESWDELRRGDAVETFDHIYLARVFDFTPIPIDVDAYPNLSYGGTGFYFLPFSDGGEHMLPHEIEHHMPDYHLYDHFVAKEIARGIKATRFRDYQDYSIGFMTRGCFRGCHFCVNQHSHGVRFHAHVGEFFDPSRKYIYLWDDNVLGYPKWREVFDELAATGRRFQFRQGMDIRIMTPEKAKTLSEAKYIGDYIFAFDHPEERREIERGLQCWQQYNHKIAKLYVLCGYDNQDQRDIEATFMRIKVLMRYGCLPYIMRHENYVKSKYRGTYINLARWCNQPNFFKKKSYRQYCESNGEASATMRYMREFEHDWPDIAEAFYDLRWEDLRFSALHRQIFSAHSHMAFCRASML